MNTVKEDHLTHSWYIEEPQSTHKNDQSKPIKKREREREREQVKSSPVA